MATGKVKWFNNKKALILSHQMTAGMMFSFTIIQSLPMVTNHWKKNKKSPLKQKMAPKDLLLSM